MAKNQANFQFTVSSLSQTKKRAKTEVEKKKKMHLNLCRDEQRAVKVSNTIPD